MVFFSNWIEIFLVNYGCSLKCIEKNLVNYGYFDNCPSSERISLRQFIMWCKKNARTLLEEGQLLANHNG